MRWDCSSVIECFSSVSKALSWICIWRWEGCIQRAWGLDLTLGPWFAKLSSIEGLLPQKYTEPCVLVLNFLAATHTKKRTEYLGF